MKIKQIIMTSLLSCIMAMTFVACSDDDGTKIPKPLPKEQWSATMKGDGEVLGAYPDLYCNYWEYTAHPTNPVEGCADANPKTVLPNDT